MARAKFTVYYQATASFSVEVDVDVSQLGGSKFYDAIREAADEQFARQGPPTLCHQCSGGMDLGDWDQDYDEGRGIYRHR